MVVDGIETTLPLFRAAGAGNPGSSTADYHIHWAGAVSGRSGRPHRAKMPDSHKDRRNQSAKPAFWQKFGSSRRGDIASAWSMTAVTPDATRRDAIGQILPALRRGLVVLTVISAGGSVHLVNKAREDAPLGGPQHRDRKPVWSFTQLQLRRAERGAAQARLSFNIPVPNFQNRLLRTPRPNSRPRLMRLEPARQRDNPVAKKAACLMKCFRSSLSGSRNSRQDHRNLRERSASTKPPGSSAERHRTRWP